jgi:hypothetical protein
MEQFFCQKRIENFEKKFKKKIGANSRCCWKALNEWDLMVGDFVKFLNLVCACKIREL